MIHRLGFGLGIGITVMMLTLTWLGLTPLVRLENTFLDFRFKLRGERPSGQEIVLVVIDEKSLKELGRWPWSRDKQAQLVTAIGADRAKVIGLDIIYAEAEVTDSLRYSLVDDVRGRDIRKAMFTSDVIDEHPCLLIGGDQHLVKMHPLAKDQRHAIPWNAQIDSGDFESE